MVVDSGLSYLWPVKYKFLCYPAQHLESKFGIGGQERVQPQDLPWDRRVRGEAAQEGHQRGDHVEPLDILLHIPLLCEDKNVPTSSSGQSRLSVGAADAEPLEGLRPERLQQV